MLDNKIELIQANIQSAQGHLQEIKEAMTSLEQVGMYPAIPHFQWQTRNGGDGKYLYLIFRQNSDGSYAGPDGKRKVYIGTGEANVAEARRLTHNREKWEHLRTEEAQLCSYIAICEGKLIGLEREADRILKHSEEWPRSISLKN